MGRCVWILTHLASIDALHTFPMIDRPANNRKDAQGLLYSYMNEGCPLRAHRSLKRYAKGDTYSIQVNQAGTTARLMKKPENSENGMIKNVQTRKAVTGS